MLVRGLFARCAGRMHASDADWCPVNGGFCREIPEGTLLLRQSDDGWVLVWCTSTTNVRPIGHGSRGDVEQDTHEVVLFGLPGGAERPGRPPWGFDEGSLHHAIGDGSFRLMLQHGERGGLVFVRHDAAVFYLGEGRIGTLTGTADARLEQHRGAPLHAWFAGRRVPLRGVGVVGVVGQAELARDVRVVLVHVDHDRFELHVATTGEACGLVGVYTGADLLRGDLGSLFVGGPAHQGASATGAQTSPEPPPTPQPEPPGTGKADQAPRPRAADRPSRPHQTGHLHDPPPPPRFTEEDHRRLDTCLTPRRKEYTGAGAMVMSYIYRGFRLLAGDAVECLADAVRQYADPLRIKLIRDRLEEKLGAPIPGHARTFTRGLLRFLVETGLGQRVGHRYQLYLGDWQRLLSMLRENYEPAAPTPDRASPQTPSYREAPEAATPSSPRAAWATASRADSSPYEFPRSGEPPVGDLPHPSDHDPGREEPVVGGWQSTLRQDGRPTYYERRYAPPDGESPSQFPGVNPRGPPDS